MEAQGAADNHKCCDCCATSRFCVFLLSMLDWCRFPGRKCICYDNSGSYERFENQNLLELNPVNEDKDDTNEKEENIAFYNDDGTCQQVVVERNLCVADLCQILCVKNRVQKSVNWSIIEHWEDLGLERTLEDHEYALTAQRDMKTFSSNAKFKYMFRKDFRKYEFFHSPEQFFPSDIVDEELSKELHGCDVNSPVTLARLVTQDLQCPVIFSSIWVQDHLKQNGAWRKAYLLLRDKKLYVSYKINAVASYLRGLKSKEKHPSSEEGPSTGGLEVFAFLKDHFVYTTLNAKNHLSAPTQWGLVLRPTVVETEEDGSTTNLRCFACDSERVRSCWLTGMRLAKYGKQLRENYKAFKNKQASENVSPKDYNSYTVPNESIRSRVAMDFTGSVGRIVEDPKEAKAIAVAEGYSWKRRWRPPNRAPTNVKIDMGVHVVQPWFHGGMTRDEASSLINRHGTVDGVFLVRESRSHQGAFVLTYKCGGKVLHTQITPLRDPIRDTYVFSLDNGVTKFYDLLQLVEFYQLNAGCLPTRLTHYVVQSSAPIQDANSGASSDAAQGSCNK